MSDLPVWIWIEIATKSALLPAAALLLVRGLARRPAAERHIVWCAAIIALLSMPAASLLVPGLAVLPRADLSARLSGPAAPQANEPTSLAIRADVPASGASDETRATPRASAPAAPVRVDGRSTPVQPVAEPPAAPFPLGSALAIAYAVITLLLLGRLFAALEAARRAVERLPALYDPAASALLEETRARLGIRRKVRLLESPSDRTPWAFGLLAPVVVVPRAFSEWPDDARRNALTHELAHVARFDYATAVLAQVCVALYWFQPLVRLACRRLALEAERACDDKVLAAGAARSDYAAQLLAVAAAGRRAPAGSPACTAMAGRPAVAARISAILAADTRRTPMTKPRAACLAVVAAAVLAPVAAVKPQSPDPAEAQVNLADPSSGPLRGPVNSEELGIAVRAYLAQGLEAEAADVIAAYLDPADRATALPGEDVRVEETTACAYCVSHAASLAAYPARHGEELDAVFAALDLLQREAREAENGDLLVWLALTFEPADVSSGHGLSLSFLLDALAVGNLTDDMQMLAANLLGRRGWHEPAKALIEQIQADPASSVPPQTLQAWLDYFDAQILAEGELKARLVSGTTAGASEYIPIYKVPPYYPEAAAGASGSVIVEFTVTEQGRTRDLEIIESSNPVFDEPALWVAKQFRYAPRIVNGSPIAVDGVRNRITFQLPQPH